MTPFMTTSASEGVLFTHTFIKVPGCGEKNFVGTSKVASEHSTREISLLTDVIEMTFELIGGGYTVLPTSAPGTQYDAQMPAELEISVL